MKQASLSSGRLAVDDDDEDDQGIPTYVCSNCIICFFLIDGLVKVYSKFWHPVISELIDDFLMMMMMKNARYS